MRALKLVVLLLVTVLCCQCDWKLEWGDGTAFEDSSASSTTSASSATSTSGGGTVSPLPEPDTWYVPPPELTPEQQLRKQEVDQFLAERYSDYDILAATQGYSGDIYYWADSNTIPFANWSPPPGTWTPEDLIASAGAELAQTELDLYSALRGPLGSTPIHRPEFWDYIMGVTSASSLQDYLQNYQVSGMPAGQDRLYAGLQWVADNRGVSGTINQFQGDVEPGTFSLIELAVACPATGPVVEQIGVVVSRDRANDRRYFPDAQPRLHIEFLTQGGAPGYAAPGKGSWDEIFHDFVPQPLRRYVPGQVVPASVLGGTQVEHRIDIFQAPNGDWWIAYQGDLLGYYPASLFKMLNVKACRVAWYGEVYDGTPTVWTWTDMGSSNFAAAAGYANVSYVKNPTFYDLVYAAYYPGDDANDLNKFGVLPYVEACYTRSPLFIGAAPWYRYFYLGGPGFGPGCN